LGPLSGLCNSGVKPKLPGLGLERLSESPQVAATPRGGGDTARAAEVGSTPRCFSIRTPPGSTPRIRSIVTPRSRQPTPFLSAAARTPTSLAAATPRSFSRVCSIVTPRTAYGTPCAPSAGQLTRPMATLQLLHEDVTSGRSHEDDACDQDRASDEQKKSKLESACHRVVINQEAAPEELHEADVDNEEADEKADEEGEESEDDEEGSEIDEPEWMSFATPCAGGLMTNFEELWANGTHNDQAGAGAEDEEPLLKNKPVALTSDAIGKLVADLAQKEVARALEEADKNRPRSAPLNDKTKRALLRRGQVSSRKPKRDEPGDIGVALTRQPATLMEAAGPLAAALCCGPSAAATASSKGPSSAVAAQMSKTQAAANRFGNGVLRAGSAMQDAGRLAREAGAVALKGHASASTLSKDILQPEVMRVKEFTSDAKKLEADARNAKIKAVTAANAVKVKLMQKMPMNRLRRHRKDEEGSQPIEEKVTI